MTNYGTSVARWPRAPPARRKTFAVSDPKQRMKRSPNWSRPPPDILQQGRHALNPQDELAKLVRERIEKRKYCMVFESQLEPCWPAEKVKTAAHTAREKEIRAFAKANGWTAEIHDPGIRVIFKKITG